MSISALAAGAGIVYTPDTGVAGVVTAGPGSVPVAVWAPNVCPPSVTPLVAVIDGAVSASIVPGVV